MAKRIKEGDFIQVATWTGATVTGTVTDFTPEGKNGRDVVDYVTRNGACHWCYTDQILNHRRATA